MLASLQTPLPFQSIELLEGADVDLTHSLALSLVDQWMIAEWK